ncbi:MAG TPA: tetratricopeptide repeat protein, partial [Burkholderiales bacterium]|nr:tetratricopeptide repeat protein [Burkholderiales bacterium]
MEPPAHERAIATGLALLRNSQVRSAAIIFESIAQASKDSRAWHYLGVARHALGSLDAAALALRASIQLSADDPEVFCALAAVLGQGGKWAEAESALADAVQRFPEHAGLHFNLAVALEQRGADFPAEAHYDTALAIQPACVQALLNRGALHLRHGRHAAALADFDALLAVQPESVDALLNRSRALMRLNRDDEALVAARQAQRLAPNRPDPRLGVATALASMGHLEAAQAEMQTGAAWDALAVYIGRGLERQDVCDWRDRDRVLQALRELLRQPGGAARIAEPGMYMRMLALPLTGEELRAAADALAASIQPAPSTVQLVTRPRRERIRLGIFAEGAGRHPETYMLRRVVGDLDRTRFEVRLYALNPDDGTELRRDLAARADSFSDLSALDSSAIVDFARQEALDVAIDPAGYFRPGRPEVFKARVAPVQVAYLATPGPQGDGMVDYRFSDALTTPAALQKLWSEKLVLLPAPHWTYDNSLVPAPPRTRAEHGLPEQGFVFCCITQAWKLEPESFSIWMRLLRAVDGSVLWLLDSGDANQNIRAAASQLGVAPERIVFAPRVELDVHLGRLSHAGLFLDTFYYNAQTTALDALWAGLPLVTRTRTTMASRLASTFARSAGLADLVTDSAETYEATALSLAQDPARLRRYADRLAAARKHAPVFDTAQRVLAFERGLQAVVDRHRAGLPP